MWRAEVTHDNDRHCEFRTGIRPTLIDEASDICAPHRHGWACPRACLGLSTSSNGAAVSFLSAPRRLSIWAAGGGTAARRASPDVIRGPSRASRRRRHGWPYPRHPRGQACKRSNAQPNQDPAVRLDDLDGRDETAHEGREAPRHRFHPSGSAEGRGRTRLTFSTASGRQKPPLYPLALSETFWSGRRDSNPRPQPWQGCALPLSYTRIRAGSTPTMGAYGASRARLQHPRGPDSSLHLGLATARL